MKNASLLILAALLPFQAMAEVQPVAILTGRGETTPEGASSRYYVPDGKVFIVESVQYYYPPTGAEPDNIDVQLIHRPHNTGEILLTYVNVGPYVRYKLYTFDKPIRLSAREAVGSNNLVGYYLWRGLLVDTTDLFASMEVELNDPRVEGNQLLADVTVSPPRPHRLAVESSEDLRVFAADPTAVVTAGTSNSDRTVAVDTDSSGKKFLRVAATARPKAE